MTTPITSKVVKFTGYVEPDQLEAMDQIARDKRVSRSDVVRWAFDDYISKNSPTILLERPAQPADAAA